MSTIETYSQEDLDRLVAQQLFKADKEICYFARYCWTLDTKETNRKKKVKRYPIDMHVHPDKRPCRNPCGVCSDGERIYYLRRTLEEMVYFDQLAYYKARQMLLTWSALVVCLHDALFIPGFNQAFISVSEKNSGELVSKCKFIYERLPLHWREYLPHVEFYAGKEGGYSRMVVEHPGIRPESDIKIFSTKAGDAIRMHGFARAYWDEVAYASNEEAKVTWGALFPTLEGGGKLLMTCSPPRSPDHFWYQMVSGEIADTGDDE